MVYKMSEKVMSMVVGYLGSKPYNEVAGLMNKLQEEFKINDERIRKEKELQQKKELKNIEPKKTGIKKKK